MDTLHRQPKTCGPNNEHAADNINYAPACVCYRSSTYDPDDLFRLNQKIDPVGEPTPYEGCSSEFRRYVVRTLALEVR